MAKKFYMHGSSGFVRINSLKTDKSKNVDSVLVCKERFHSLAGVRVANGRTKIGKLVEVDEYSPKRLKMRKIGLRQVHVYNEFDSTVKVISYDLFKKFTGITLRGSGAKWFQVVVVK